ncbi:MAG TPA: DUF4168 domain-containing protein [Casimicrobiaceae bacterium]|nr:DUF4168 domain-containing protein [Casimicrobiaceae bacterium]
MGGPPAFAQVDSNAPDQGVTAEPSTPYYSDDELKSFVGAALDVIRVKDAYTPLLEAAATPEQATLVKQQASAEMTKAVEGQGMTVDRFQEILTNAQGAPDLAARINQQLQSR